LSGQRVYFDLIFLVLFVSRQKEHKRKLEVPSANDHRDNASYEKKGCFQAEKLRNTASKVPSANAQDGREKQYAFELKTFPKSLNP